MFIVNVAAQSNDVEIIRAERARELLPYIIIPVNFPNPINTSVTPDKAKLLKFLKKGEFLKLNSQYLPDNYLIEFEKQIDNA